MVSSQEVKHIAELADIGITGEELEEFTRQFNGILEYFGILDRVPGAGSVRSAACNVMREDDVVPSLSHEDVVRLGGETEDGYIRAPRVM
ncbi:MAG: Asp-tRNA(Asn)/Glu-tRNA(Gln) amidotransferase subunit GatC [Methanomicrobiales archaeon]|nr:Asp-tRNA(Asn)/Glu-tRNA(Gln) amidotransferase subunit GatC [Methanomicrobiales archaeon]MDI6875149.1 Asp-tRNA(Asn)/Glu-tRNA(Gln) amidotransferase subunit GatC [Methanomicrobiales archaeon]